MQLSISEPKKFSRLCTFKLLQYCNISGWTITVHRVSFFRSRFWTAVWNCSLPQPGLLRKLISNVFIFKSNLFRAPFSKFLYTRCTFLPICCTVLEYWKVFLHLNLSSTLSLNFRGWVVQLSLFLKQKNVQFIPYSECLVCTTHYCSNPTIPLSLRPG